MTTTISLKANAIKTLSILCVVGLAFACSNGKSNAPTTDATAQTAATTDKSAAESVTISGIVKAVKFGKDGYTADVQTEKDGLYAALVSIVNVGGPDKHKSCEVGDEVGFKGVASEMNGVKNLLVKEILFVRLGNSGASAQAGRVPEDTHTLMSIEPTGFRGIKIGDVISKLSSDFVKKTTMKTGEGSFTAYAITDFDNNPAGYFMPDPNNKLLVGDITVETVMASTDKGIKVGDTFKDLLKAYPNIEVHGSESEGRTYATAGKISFRLNKPNFTYEVDKAKIPATTKITQIVIGRK
jgi:hypothetical protein